MTVKPQPLALETLLQHSGSEHRLGRGLVAPTENSVTFRTPSPEDAPVYARLSNTGNHFEVQALLAALEGTEEACVFGSGMAAMAAVCFTFLRPGDHVLAQANCYGGNEGFLSKVATRFGINASFVPLSDWRAALRPETKLLYLESISNPFCEPQDLKAAVALAKERGIRTLCDNTFASPALIRPADLGIDFVLESGTKYLNGHSDLVCGVVAGSKTLMSELRATAMYLGGFLPAPGCVQLLRGLRTLALRMRSHSENGAAFAAAMRQSELVKDVFYGSDKPSIAAEFKAGFGGMVAVRFAAGLNVEALLRHTHHIADVPSLGGTETTACMPFHTTHFWMSPEQKAAAGVDKSLVRFSVGIERVEDVVADVLAAAAWESRYAPR